MSQVGDVGLIGLAVMGKNLALNIQDKGYGVVVFNRTVAKVDVFLNGLPKGNNIQGARSIQDLCMQLKRPRKVILMVQAGKAVDELIAELLPYLEAGDIIIDGGNSYFLDTERRVEQLKAHSILFVGCGISGGEEGARYGPSMMPGGNEAAWPVIRDLLQKIAAKAEGDSPCCEWMGKGGAGHYVKMVHNGIEYGDMELIAEVYHLLRVGLHIDNMQLSRVFNEWNKGPLESYLIEITARIFEVKDIDGKPLLDKVLDVAVQKGTGIWTGINALELGVPASLIIEAVLARALSSCREERLKAFKLYEGLKIGNPDIKLSLESIRDALYASKIVSYAQGFMLMRSIESKMKWGLHYHKIASIWRGGCIIRSRFLTDIQKAFCTEPNLSSLLLDSFFKDQMIRFQRGWRETIAVAVQLGVPIPSLSVALSFFDGFRSNHLPTNLIQAQRDCFGAHTYERNDKPRGEIFHTSWLKEKN